MDTMKVVDDANRRGVLSDEDAGFVKEKLRDATVGSGDSNSGKMAANNTTLTNLRLDGNDIALDSGPHHKAIDGIQQALLANRLRTVLVGTGWCEFDVPDDTQREPPSPKSSFSAGGFTASRGSQSRLMVAMSSESASSYRSAARSRVHRAAARARTRGKYAASGTAQ